MDQRRAAWLKSPYFYDVLEEERNTSRTPASAQDSTGKVLLFVVVVLALLALCF